ncbi:MAG: ArsR/SmtB family transcription factor [Aminivibrio sp.]
MNSAAEKNEQQVNLEAVAREMPPEEALYDLAELFRAFGDTTRIKILSALSLSDLCVADIATLLSMNQPAISHQLRVLRQARLVRVTRKGRSSIYALDDEHVRAIFDQGFRHVRHTMPEGGDLHG